MTIDETKGTGAAAPSETTGPAAADAPPSGVSLDVVTAMHDRLLKLRAAHDQLDEEMGASGKVLEALGKTVRDELLAKLADIEATVGQHADLIDGLTHTLTEITARVTAAPRPRGEGERRLPSTPLVPLLPGQEQETELQIDPRKEGTQTVALPGSGKLVEVRVRRPTSAAPADGAPAEGARGPVIRDGKPVGSGAGRVRRS